MSDSPTLRRSSRILVLLGTVSSTIQQQMTRVAANGYDVTPKIPCVAAAAMISMGVERTYIAQQQLSVLRMLIEELRKAEPSKEQREMGNAFLMAAIEAVALAIRSTGRASAVHDADHRDSVVTIQEQYLKALDEGMKHFQNGEHYRAFDKYVACLGLDAEIRGVDPLHDMANLEQIPLYNPVMTWLNSQPPKTTIEELNKVVDGLSLPIVERPKVGRPA